MVPPTKVHMPVPIEDTSSAPTEVVSVDTPSAGQCGGEGGDVGSGRRGFDSRRQHFFVCSVAMCFEVMLRCW